MDSEKIEVSRTINFVFSLSTHRDEIASPFSTCHKKFIVSTEKGMKRCMRCMSHDNDRVMQSWSTSVGAELIQLRSAKQPSSTT